MSNAFEYSPDEDVLVHPEGTIKLICKPFLAHENGLPEWLKNSADAYVRDAAHVAQRVIVVILTNAADDQPGSISCLDFSGMTSTQIEEQYRIWGDPDAATAGDKSAAVQGGHGNGGKCYITHMFDDHGRLHTVKRSLGNRYGVGSGSIQFGYVPDRAGGRDFVVPDLEAGLATALSEVTCSLDAVRDVAGDALDLADGFTMVSGYGPKGYDVRISAKQIVSSLQEHPQMIATLELCTVQVIVDGEHFSGGKPLELPYIAPMDGAEEPKVIEIPDFLEDPADAAQVSTNQDGSLPQGKLSLKTSKVSMR